MPCHKLLSFNSQTDTNLRAKFRNQLGIYRTNLHEQWKCSTPLIIRPFSPLSLPLKDECFKHFRTPCRKCFFMGITYRDLRDKQLLQISGHFLRRHPLSKQQHRLPLLVQHKHIGTMFHGVLTDSSRNLVIKNIKGLGHLL